MRRTFALISAGLTALFLTGSSNASMILFEETFDGYSSFPNQAPQGDPINSGRPRVIEGADEEWIGARIELPDGGSVDSDLAVQQVGGLGNNTPVGRVEDDAAIVLKLDLTEYQNVALTFQWRTFLADTTDKLVVQYYVGDGLGSPGNNYDWFNDPALGNGQMVNDPSCGTACVNPWVRDNWTELQRAQDNSAWHAENFALPGGDFIYVAFWMDNGEGDYAKIDDVVVSGDFVPIPEPSSAALLALGLAGLSLARRLR